MTMHDMIFSNDRSNRIGRHIAFWIAWYFFMASTTLRIYSPEDIGMRVFIFYQLEVTAVRIILQIIFCYTVVYFMVPHYLQKKKYIQFGLTFTLFLFCFYCITYYYYYHFWVDKTSPLFVSIINGEPLSSFRHQYYIFYSHLNYSGTLVSSGIFLVINYYKFWHKKQQENELLINENTRAELQLLKAQIHPHFLFNTLNNIYALALDDSPKAPVTVKKLSGMIHYMINEGAEPFVTVSKEIKMLVDYIGLEKIRYGDRLKMTIDIRQCYDDNRLIAPLLMLPFVENCFKHGASKTMETAHIDINIRTGNEWLECDISNSMPHLPEKPDDRKKIGLQNVQKRLQLLYPDKHLLEIKSNEQSFNVYMAIKLEKQKPGIEEPIQYSTINKTVNYAS